MNTDTDLQRQVTSVFADAAPSGYPDELLARVLSTTSRNRPRPTWLASIKEPPMRIPARVVVGSPTLRLATFLVLILTLALIGAAAAAAAASLLPSPTLDPYGPARNGALVFDRGGDIYLADPDGGNSHAIIGGDAPAFGPWFSHDGTHIAYGTGPDDAVVLMIAKADGTDAQALPALFEWWDFMPADDAIVGTRIVDDHMVLSTHKLGSGTVQDIPLSGIEPNGWVEARPRDGAELIFTGRPNGDPTALGLYAVKPDGSDLRTIGAVSTDESPSDATQPTRWSMQDPSLAPDGSTIAYWSWEPQYGGQPDAYLHRRDLDTGAELPVPGDGIGNAPQYSPDGASLLFEGGLGSGSSLFAWPTDGSAGPQAIGPIYSYLDRLGHGISPDGRQAILLLRDQPMLVDIQSGETTVLPIDPAPDALPSWQRQAP